MKNRKFILSSRPHAVLISNHGYAGIHAPVCKAPDSGGQIVYVHYLARSLEKNGYKVSIFTRGGFPEYKSKKVRSGTGFLSPWIRYVYIPAGPPHFIPKEDIAPVLDEETGRMHSFLKKEARIKKTNIHEYISFINSHYWDAGLIGCGLVSMMQTDLFLEELDRILDIPDRYLRKRYDGNRNHDVFYQTGAVFLSSLEKKFPDTRPGDSLNKDPYLSLELSKTLCISLRRAEHLLTAFSIKSRHTEPAFRQIERTAQLGRIIIQTRLPGIKEKLERLNMHIWCPHTLGTLKERNTRDMDPVLKKGLRLKERIRYEKTVSPRVSLLMATSREIIKVLHDDYQAAPDKIFYFPPCNDDTLFRPRSPVNCKKAWAFLKRKTCVKNIREQQIILESSRMDHSKRKDILVRAFRLIAEKNGNTLLLIGGGPANEVERSLKKLVGKLRLKDRVFFIGFLNPALIGPIFSIPLMYVTPSEMEGFGMSVLNAISSRVPVIASGKIPLAQQHLKHCALIPKDNSPAELAAAMEKYLNDASLRKRNSRKAFLISRSFQWPVLTRLFIRELKRRNLV
ncbi:MAG: glycosyltransferase [bacterium]|nr:glycosyltransferase [bacterium]